MALLTCKDCKKEFSTDAKRCPHCGAKKPGRFGCLTTAAIIFLMLYIFLMMVPSPPSTPEDLETKQLNEARQICQQFVTDSLHDPDSAKFDDFWDFPVERQKSGIYRVEVRLRARNGFNAVRRMRADCQVKPTGSGKWKLVSLKEF